MLICGMLKNNYSGYQHEVGTDEAGRGCLSGPVVAAAVILPFNYHNELLNDSKQLSEAKRKILRPIIEKDALAFVLTCLISSVTSSITDSSAGSSLTIYYISSRVCSSSDILTCYM